MIMPDEYDTPEIVPISMQDKLNELAESSGVKFDMVINAYKTILAGIERNAEARFAKALEITTFQLQTYVQRNGIKPVLRREKDKHTPAQVRYAERLYAQLMGQNRKG